MYSFKVKNIKHLEINSIIKNLSIIYLILTSVNQLFSVNTSTTDSLKLLTLKSQKDTVKINLLLKIANTYEENNNDSTIHYYNLATSISKEIGNKNKEGESLNLLANYYFRSNKFTEAIKYFNNALKV